MSSDISLLAEVADVVDSLHKTPAYVEQGYPMVRVTDVKYGALDLSKTLKVDEATFKEFSRRYTPQPDDIIITRVGTYGVFGKVVNFSFCLGQNTAAIIPKDISAKYLYAVLNSDFVRSQIEAGVVGSTQKTLSLKAIKALKIPRMGLAQEAEIATFSSSLDDRITLLRETNATLEAIAQALFKSWFVDFDPVRAKMEGRAPEGMDEATAALFPERLEETELGVVPRGWWVRAFSDVCVITSGKRPITRSDYRANTNFVPLYGGAGVMGYTSDELFDAPKILTGRVGTLGKVHIAYPPFWASDNVLVISPSNSECFAFAFHWLQSIDVASLNRGSTQPLLTQKDLGAQMRAIPSTEILIAFEGVVASLYSQIRANAEHCQTLSTLRDTLLPRLISSHYTQLPHALQ